MGIEFRVLDMEDSDDVIAIVADTLLMDEPQCRSLGATHPYDTKKFVEAVVPKVVNSGMSIGAFDCDTGEMMGCRLTLLKLANIPTKTMFDITDPREEKMAKIELINQFIYREFDVFEETGADEVVHFYGLMVRRAHRQKGIARKLVEKAIEVAQSKGYAAVLCEASNNYSRGIFQKLGFRQLRVVRFDEFMINGDVVFKNTYPHELYTLHCLNI